MNSALALIEEMLPYLRNLKPRLGDTNWPMFVERGEKLLARELRKHEHLMHPRLRAHVQAGTIKLYDAYYLAKLDMDRQLEICNRIDTITVEEFNHYLLIGGKKYNG